MLRALFLSLTIFGSLLFSDEYAFKGKHFVGSYLECDTEALRDLNGLVEALDDAVNSSGATVLDKAEYVFPPDGLTAVYLLSESHASIHTYPEHGSCFVDLFTCGDTCSSKKFDEALRAYLNPKTCNTKVFSRGTEIEEISEE